MYRQEESESTPKKRNTKQQLEAVAIDAVTKSGRKVKRPAHLDSPERALSASPSSDARKSVAARAHKANELGNATTPGKRAAAKELVGSPQEVRSSRKTIASAKTTNPGKQLDTPKGKAAKESIVDDSVGFSKSGRKIKIPAKLTEFDSEVLSSPSRKNVVPDNDEPTKDKPTKTPGRAKTPAKPTMKNISMDDDKDDNKKAARKTPGRRAKSVAPSDEPEVETVPTPGRRGVTSLFQKELSPAEPSHPKTTGKRVDKTLLDAAVNAQPKTPGRRAKSMAPTRDAMDDTESKTSIKTIQTPTRRAGKSIVNPGETSKSPHGERSDCQQKSVPKTPGRRAGKSMVSAASVESPAAQRSIAKTPGRPRLLKSIAVDKIESDENLLNTDSDLHSAEQASESSTAQDLLSRSGRKIKPKKVFDFEQDKKTTDQAADGSRKRKAENTEESSIDTMMLSPMKRKTTASVDDARQTPKVKSRLASQTDNETTVDGSVSRSGRKIKPKIMFGFEDGDTSAALVDITGSSPTLDKESAARGKIARNALAAKAKSGSTPAKARAISSAEIHTEPRSAKTNHEMDGLVDETGEPLTFITKRGVNDHHRQKVLLSLDETDHAMPGSEPMIIRTSIGFGKPKVQKPAPPQQRAEGDDDNSSKLTADVASPSRKDAQLVGNSRSGRKIKPKKFYDTDETTSSDRPSVDTVKEKQTVLSSPTKKASEQQKLEESRATSSSVDDTVADTVADEMMATDEEGVDIPEGPATILASENEPPVTNPTEDGEVQTPEQEITTITSDSNDVEMEPEKDIPAVEKDVEGKNVLTDETVTKEESSDAAQLVEEKSEEVPEKQETDRVAEESSEDKNDLQNDVIPPDVVNSDGSESVVQSVATEEKPLPEALIENSSEKNNEVTRHETADEKDGSKATIETKANEPGQPNEEAPIETTTDDKHVSVTVADDDITPEGVEQISEVIPIDDSNVMIAMQNDAEILDDTSFGDIEYLENEKNNIVEHIQKPSPDAEPSVSPSPPEEAVGGPTTLSSTAVPSIVVIPETPVAPPYTLNDTCSPVVPNRGVSSSGVTVIDITTDTPRPVVAATAPHTPDPKLLAKQEATDKCSPDKPPEVIEITDSPAVAAFCKQINAESARGTEGGSATSTPLAVRSALLQYNQELVDDEQEQLHNEGRKRSLSASAADMAIKRNVTFHSPANSTMLVETIDERLILKSLQDQQQQQQDTIESSSSSCSKGIGEKLRKPRKRSLSEHKPSEMKRSKVSKLPNFKSIHANHFNRMESLAEFMKRKESRAKQILSSCSPATKLLASSISITTDAAAKPSGVTTSAVKKVPPSTTKPFVFKSAGGGGIPVPSSGVVAGLFVKRTKEASTAAKVGPGGPDEHHHHQALSTTATVAASAAKKPIPSNTERMANRLKQFQTNFRPKQVGTGTADKTVTGPLASTASTSRHAAVGGDRPVEQLRSKQTKILKGVRTNRRFELQMKHRDNVQHQ